MKKIHVCAVLAAIAVLTVPSCERANDWDVDPSYAQLFKALTFETAKVGATEVEIRYTKTVNADRYTFEFSKDSLRFGEIVRTVEILADTLTPFAPSSIPARVEYRTLFGDLDGLTGYSVRMKGTSTQTGETSGYRQLYFETAAEQLFGSWRAYIDRIVMHWPPTDRVSHVAVYASPDGTERQNIPLSATDKASGSIEITGLQPGSRYRIVIFNADNARGAREVKTLGIAGGEMITVRPGDDIPLLVANAVADGKPDITLVFAGGQIYDLAILTLPAGVENLSVTGNPDANGNKPRLNIDALAFSDMALGEIVFENVDLYAVPGSSFLIAQTQNGSVTDAYIFRDCYIERFGNGVVRLNNAATVRDILFDNCVLDRIGGWGVVNVGGSTATVDLISFTNSTLIDLATQLMDVRVAAKKIVIESCTFYNQNTGLVQLLRFDTNRLPLEFASDKNILAGTNNGAGVNATSYDHASFGLNVSFAGSYRTNEWQIARPARDFTDITVFDGTADELFADPGNGDFHIRTGNGFGGRGTAGDPRWLN